MVSIEENGPTDAAGLRQGDVIVQVGEQRVKNVEDLLSELRQTDPDDKLQLVYSRGGQRQEATITVGTRPE